MAGSRPHDELPTDQPHVPCWCPDPTCHTCSCSPWCFVGKRRLEKAMSTFAGQLDFEVRWHPFQLDPTAPVEGRNKMEMYYEKFGKARVEQIMPMMTKWVAFLVGRIMGRGSGVVGCSARKKNYLCMIHACGHYLGVPRCGKHTRGCVWLPY